MTRAELKLHDVFWRLAVPMRRILLLLMYGNSRASWDSYLRERYGSKVESRYFLAIERVKMKPAAVNFVRFWNGKRWMKEELRARMYGYLGAWWRAFVMAKNDSIVIVRRPYSPRDWSPS